MRHARDAQFLYDGEILLGVNLGADYCAEHEWGYMPILKGFGVDSSLLGLDGRRATKTPEILFKDVQVEGKKCHILVYDRPFQMKYHRDRTGKSLIRSLDLHLWDLDKGDISTSWCENGFAILVSHEHHMDLETLYLAMQSQDICIGIGPGGPFKNGGLTLSIYSRFPKQLADDLYEQDLDYKNLHDTAHATGIYEKLEEAGCKFHALSPRWANDEKTEVQFWLNPWDQSKYYFGWVTLKDLEDWAEGKGKIVENKR